MSNPNANTIQEIVAFLGKLSDNGIYSRLAANRADAISIEVTVPDERWEIDFLEDGTIEIEVFKSIGMFGSEKLQELFDNFSDPRQ